MKKKIMTIWRKREQNGCRTKGKENSCFFNTYFFLQAIVLLKCNHNHHTYNIQSHLLIPAIKNRIRLSIDTIVDPFLLGMHLIIR